MSITITRNPAIGGAVGGGASPDAVAAAVLASLPPQPSAYDIAQVVAASIPAPATVLAGQVVEFSAGHVPAGYAQVSGGETVLPADTGLFAYINFQNKCTYANTRLCPAGSRLFAAAYNTTGSWYMQELASDYSKIGSAVAVPSHGTSYPILTVQLSDGKILRIGGTTDAWFSGITQVFNPATGAFSSLANKPTATAGGLYSKAAQAGDGKVYGAMAQGSQSVSAFNYAANTWAENVATSPAVAENTIGICKLPSGKLFWVTTTGQYVFDYSTLAFTQIGTYTGTGGAVVETDSGARLYFTLGNTVVFYEYTEASNTWATVTTDAPKLSSHLTTTDPPFGIQAVRNPYTGAVVIKSVFSSKSETAYLHLLRYTPKATVKAVKL